MKTPFANFSATTNSPKKKSNPGDHTAIDAVKINDEDEEEEVQPIFLPKAASDTNGKHYILQDLASTDGVNSGDGGEANEDD